MQSCWSFLTALLKGKGDPSLVNDPSKVLISARIAKKYFDEENPVGKTISIYAGQPLQKNLTVGAVLEDQPLNSSLYYDFITFEDNAVRGDQPFDRTDWSRFVDVTFLRLENPNEVAGIEEQLQQFVAIQNASRENWTLSKFSLGSMITAAHDGDAIASNALNESFPSAAVWGPLIMAILLLFAACLNFANTTISLSGKRLKEMGVRKVMGGTQRQLMIQLLAECLAISFLALMLGILIADWLLPVYNAMWPYLHLVPDYSNNFPLLMFLVGVLLFTTFLAGSYPAFYISSFNPSSIFRGAIKFGGTNLFSRILLGVQISISLVAVIGGFAFANNANYQKNKDMGYNKDQMIIVPIDPAKYETFKNQVAQNAFFDNVVGANHHIGYSYHTYPVAWQEEKKESALYRVSSAYFGLYGNRSVERKNF